MTAKARNRIALPAALSAAVVLGIVALVTTGADSGKAAGDGAAAGSLASSNAAISPRNQADALHLVIAADRELYCRQFVAALAETPAARSWPLPEEMFHRAARSIQGKGAEFSYALRSLHPIDPRNGPQTDLERRGLEFVTSHPTENYYGPEMLGGRRYFTGVYPDLPAAAACVDCHNRRAAATGHRYKVGEVMGGVVVRIPLEF